MNNVLEKELDAKFIAWLACVKGFLPQKMTLHEAFQIFIRRDTEDKSTEYEKKKN